MRSNLKAACALHKDFCQQSRVQRHSHFFCWHVTLEIVWAREPKVLSQKNSSSKALPNGKNGAHKTFFYFIVVLFHSTGQSSSSDVVFYSIGSRSLSLIEYLKDNTGLYLFGRWRENKWHFCLKSRAEQKSKGTQRVLRLSEHCCPLHVWDNSKLEPF